MQRRRRGTFGVGTTLGFIDLCIGLGAAALVSTMPDRGFGAHLIIMHHGRHEMPRLDWLRWSSMCAIPKMNTAPCLDRTPCCTDGIVGIDVSFAIATASRATAPGLAPTRCSSTVCSSSSPTKSRICDRDDRLSSMLRLVLDDFFVAHSDYKQFSPADDEATLSGARWEQSGDFAEVP